MSAFGTSTQAFGFLRSRRVVAQVFLVVLGAEGSLRAQSVTLTPPSSDVFLSSAHDASNYGRAGAIGVSGSGSAKGEFDSLLRFDFSTVKSNFDSFYGPGNWKLDTVTLSLTAQLPVNAIFNTQAAGSLGIEWIKDDTWVEGTGSPNAPTTDGITFGELATLRSGGHELLGTYAFDGGTADPRNFALGLTPGLETDVTLGSLVSFLLKPADANVSALFYANGMMIAAQNKPMLTVTAVAVPEPVASVFLLAGGLLGIGARWRRR